MIFSASSLTRLALHTVLIAVELVGDDRLRLQGLKISAVPVLDNLTHGMVATISWAIVIDFGSLTFRQLLFEIITCGVIGCLIDLDHFVAARSLHLKDALNLTRRPFLHCTTTVMLIGLVTLFVSWQVGASWLGRSSWIFLVATLSHHLRDSIRRGLWLVPFGSTPPIPYWLYLVTTAAFPHFVRILISATHQLHSSPDPSMLEL